MTRADEKRTKGDAILRRKQLDDSNGRRVQERKMDKPTQIGCLFLDIGGVLLTDGWNIDARKRAAATFDLDFSAMEDRHRLVFAVYEEGKLSLEDYLNRTVFFKDRPFSRDQFREFMFAQSRPHLEMIRLIRTLKSKHGLKTIVVSNEARELNSYRIQKFGLERFIDAFVSSCFVGMRKPDTGIFRLALDIAQVPPERILYLENTAMFVEVGKGLGIHSILHTDLESTRRYLAPLGLRDDTLDEQQITENGSGIFGGRVESAELTRGDKDNCPS